MLTVSVKSKTFPAQGRGEAKHVLKDCVFSVHEGGLVAVVGPSGCGKTTLINVIAGLDDEYQGYVSRPNPQSPVGYVFQNARLLPWRTALDNVVLAGDDVRVQEAKAMLARVGLKGEEDMFPNRMSGGMKRRLAIARALVIDPDVLLLDEPFVSLDEPSAHRLRLLLMDLLAVRPRTTVFVTHNLREAAALADRVIFLSESPSRVIFEVSPQGEKGRRGPKELNAFFDQISRHPQKEIRELMTDQAPG